MRSDGILRRALFAGTALTFVAAAGAMPARAESSAEQLAAVLANKGVISQSEARSISAAPPAAQQGRLVSILRKKGVLGDDDIKTLKPEPRSVEVAPPIPSTAMAADTPHIAEPMYRKAAITVGGFEITPVGYIALTSVTRSTNTGNVVGTNFGKFLQQHDRGQYRRNAPHRPDDPDRPAGAFGGEFWLDIVGYIETDFNGNDAANVFVSTNPHTERLRLAMDINAGPLEFTAGQT